MKPKIFYGILLSAGMSAMLYLPAWTVIAKWFRRRLSLAVLAPGSGFGGNIWAPISSILITNYGWRSAFVIHRFSGNRPADLHGSCCDVFHPPSPVAALNCQSGIPDCPVQLFRLVPVWVTALAIIL